MTFTVNKIAQLTGVSVRSLHYYDEIGLLKPNRSKNNGYRIYDDKDLIRLQQILFFISLDFSLEKIRNILDDPKFDSLQALIDQKQLLSMEKSRLNNLIETLSNLINNFENKKQMTKNTNDDNFVNMDQYKEEAKMRWGNTDAYKQSQERLKKMSKEDLEKIGRDGELITKEIADLMQKGFDNDEVQNAIEKHYQHMNIFYDCSFEMYNNLGKMYVEDGRFTAYYEKFAPGLAEFMQKAINYYCEKQK